MRSPNYASAIAGPKDPHQHIPTSKLKAHGIAAESPRASDALDDGAVVIASITSCTNTSNPRAMIAAGLLARNAHARGLHPHPWVTLDCDLSFSRARFKDDDPVGNKIPGSLDRVISAGFAVDPPEAGQGVIGSLRLRHFGPRPLIEDGRAKWGRLRFRHARPAVHQGVG